MDLNRFRAIKSVMTTLQLEQRGTETMGDEKTRTDILFGEQCFFK
jgi:hypothetical protein